MIYKNTKNNSNKMLQVLPLTLYTLTTLAECATSEAIFFQNVPAPIKHNKQAI